jgi:hypothetical protein
MKAKFKEGDIVKVWSLQSFHGGGFLKGVEGIVTQDCTGGGSVFVTVERNINGVMKVDPYYEVYEQQLEFVHRPKSRPSNFQQLIYDLKSR